MRQALHILRKDANYLWPDIVIVNAASAGYTFGAWAMASRFLVAQPGSAQFWAAITALSGLALVVMTMTMIGRLVHAEAIPGDRQFWTTRPYDWRSLLAAKVAFLAVFVSLPLLALRLAALTIMGFPITASFGALFWSHIVLIVVVGVPAIALASITKGHAPFIGLLVGLWVLTGVLAFMPGALTGEPTTAWGDRWPETFEWIRHGFIAAYVVAASSLVLYLQYRRRKTGWSRAVLLAAIILGSAAYFALPIGFGLALQTLWPGSDREAAGGVQVAVKSPGEPLALEYWSPRSFSVSLSGMDSRTLARPDAVRARLIAPDGREWDSGWGLFEDGVWFKDYSERSFEEFRTAAKDQPLTLRVTVYATLWNDSQPPLTLRLTVGSDEQTYWDSIAPESFVAVGAAVECAATGRGRRDGDWALNAKCRRPGGWANEALAADVIPHVEGSGQYVTFQDQSYSPFPDGLTLQPTANLRYSVVFPAMPANTDSVSLRILKPTAHFKREIEAHDLRVGAPFEIVR